MLRVGSIVLRVDDLQRQAEFWAEALKVPPRIHLDLYPEDHAPEVERLKAVGATEVHWSKRPADADYIILADPEGNRFCVVDASQ